MMVRMSLPETVARSRLNPVCASTCRLGIGYSRAAHLTDMLEERVVGMAQSHAL
jgi:hypothetical protein